jgi:Uma2 family endonuclease
MSEQLEQPPRFDIAPAYLAWALEQDRRTELWDGEVVVMATERVRHNRVKGGVYAALQAAIRDAALPCEVFTDGISVEAGPRTVYEPDALVQCCDRLPGDALVAPSPVIIVEVASPLNDRREMTTKFRDYFALPSVQHYLVFYHDKPLLLHHRRDADGTIHTASITGGRLVLDPPGIGLDVEPLLLPE